MKHLTATFPEDAPVDLTSLVMHATTLNIDVVDEKEQLVPTSRKVQKKDAKGRGLREMVMSHFTHSGSFSKITAEKWAKNNGFNPKSINQTLSRLIDEGYLRKAGNVPPYDYYFLKPMPGVDIE